MLSIKKIYFYSESIFTKIVTWTNYFYIWVCVASVLTFSMLLLYIKGGSMPVAPRTW